MNMQMILSLVLILCCIRSYVQSAGINGVQLTQLTPQQTPCPGEEVVYMCTVPGNLLRWRIVGESGNRLVDSTSIEVDLNGFRSVAGVYDTVNSCFSSTLTFSARDGISFTCLTSDESMNESVTITVQGNPNAPGRPNVTFSITRREFNITWDEPPMNMGGTVDAYFVSISGPNDLCGTGNTLQNVTERTYTCSIQTTPQEGETYTIRVMAANCDGSLRGPESDPVRLQVPDAPSFTFQPGCPDLSFVDVFWQSPARNSMIVPLITEVCVNCTGPGDNCTFECRPVSSNNSFRIYNITRGANYTVCLTLRNDFGQSGENCTSYGEDMMECPTGTTATTPPSTTPTTTGSDASNMPVGSSLGPPIGGAVGGICVLLLILIDIILCEMWLKRQSDESACMRIVLVVLLFVTVFGIPIAIAVLIYEHCCKSEKCDTEKVSTCCWIIIIAVLLLTFVGIPIAIALLLHHRYKTMQVSTFVAVLFMFLSVFGIPLAIAVIIYECCCKSEKEKRDEDVELRGSSPDKSSPPAEATDSAPAPLLYADPSTIPREEHPTTGDVYSMPDKSRKTHKPDDHLPTYQDPGAISHEAAPTGELYTVPDKKKGAKKKKQPQASRPTEEQLAEMYSQPDKTRKQQSQGLNYADVGFNAPSSGKVPEKPPQVFYADVKM